MAEEKKGESSIFAVSSKDGHFRRAESAFRSTISRAPGADFPPEPNRYVLYVVYSCPWAHRANIVRSLKGLESLIQLVVLDPRLTADGWKFTGEYGSATEDPLYGFRYLRDLYLKADPGYQGRYTVPVLWDTKRETIVSNESSEIIRMLALEFDDLVAPGLREENRPGGGIYPERLRTEIDDLNGWVYDRINNGVYKAGFASTQEAYDANVYPLFEALDRVEQILADGRKFLLGEHLTEADVRLYPTIVRFDVAYHHSFKCNLKMIRHDYPSIHRWLRMLYWDESDLTNHGAFRKTTFFDTYKLGYQQAAVRKLGYDGEIVVPAGPVPHILPLDEN
ncbi:hypothetical protein VTO42DRAFT_5157 [Malbranchea cinnamomea]